MTDSILMRAASLLRPVPDFPKPGILFFDLNPLLRDLEALDHIANLIADYWRPHNIDVVAGFDSRGFLFGPMVAERLGLKDGFTMIRKKGKLPPPVKSVSYGLEYGSDVIEMADDGFIEGKRVLLIDDLLATGGTAGAGVELVKLLGGTTAGFACVSELPEIGGRQKLMHVPVQSLITIMDGKPLVGVEYCVDIFTRCALTNSLLLINRLGEVPGTALPGGRIEPGESALEAASRELEEETGAVSGDISYVTTLTGIERDPRGPKVSVVVETRAHVGPLKGEVEKTEPFWVNSEGELPAANAFVFAHGPLVHDLWFASQKEHRTEELIS